MDSQFSNHLDKLKKRLHNSRVTITNIYDKVIEKITGLDELNDSISDSEFSSELCKIFEEVKEMEPLKKVCLTHNESYAHISRLGKEIEKAFPYQIEELNTHKSECLDPQLLDSVVADYLISNQFYEEANKLCEKSYIHSEKIGKIHESINFLESGDIENALKCVEEMGGTSKKIMFCIHKLKFIQILKAGNMAEAMDFAKQHIQKYADTNLEEIKHLMCACLFDNTSESSPYSYLFKDNYTKDTLKEILDEWSNFAEISLSSPLVTIVKTGDQVIPELIPLAQLAGPMFWKNPMPTELKLDNKLLFHSTFVCPVSKEVTTPENPPVMLPCGHVISKHSVDRYLSTSSRAKFKCPTCPVEVTEKETKKLVI